MLSTNQNIVDTVVENFKSLNVYNSESAPHCHGNYASKVTQNSNRHKKLSYSYFHYFLCENYSQLIMSRIHQCRRAKSAFLQNHHFSGYPENGTCVGKKKYEDDFPNYDIGGSGPTPAIFSAHCPLLTSIPSSDLHCIPPRFHPHRHTPWWS